MSWASPYTSISETHPPFVSAQVWYIDIDTEAKLTGIPSFDVEIDPWVVKLGFGRKF